MGAKRKLESAGAGAAGYAAGGVAGTALASTVGFLAGPIGAAAGAALATLWVKHQDHWKADEFVQGATKPFSARAGAIIDRLNAAHAAGTLTYAAAQAGQKEFDAEVADYEDAGRIFGARGRDHQKVIDQDYVKGGTWDTVGAWKNTIGGFLKQYGPASGDPTDPSMTAPGTILGMRQAKQAGEQQRKRTLSYRGRQSTILAGGIGPSAVTEKKTLLGY